MSIQLHALKDKSSNTLWTAALRTLAGFNFLITKGWLLRSTPENARELEGRAGWQPP